MEQLWEQISRRLIEARRRNVDGQWFVPRPKLDEIFDWNSISEIVRQGGLSPHRDDPALAVSSLPGQVDKIYQTAKTTFAILCHLGIDYLGYIFHLENYGDSMGSNVDDHLPLTKESLISCKLRTNHAVAFEQIQWHFITTRIRLGVAVMHEYRPEVILPIEFSKTGGQMTTEGAFGAVTEIYIERIHQAEPAYTGRVISLAFRVRCQLAY